MQKIAEDMQIFADNAKDIDNVFTLWYNRTIKSKRLQKRAAPAREAAEPRDADTGSKKKIKKF